MTENELERILAPLPASVGVARDLIEQMLRKWGLDHLRGDLCLVVSELVTNAVKESPWYGNVKIHIKRDKEGVLLSVWDQSQGRPETRRDVLSVAKIDRLPEDYQFGGWGLAMVEDLSTSCGVNTMPGFGKWVWARFQV